MAGAETDRTPPTRASLRSRRHPSAPIPVHGAPLGESVRVPLGETGVDVFPVVLGTSEFGWRADIAASHRILDTYRGVGGNAIYTSDAYASGRSEHFIGQWLTSRKCGDEMTLALRVGSHPDFPGLGATNLVRSVESSLGRLQSEVVDLLLLDASERDDTPLEHILATAGWLVETGKVRSVGAVGLTATQLVEARILAAAGYPRLTVADVPYNLLRREEVSRDLRLVLSAQGIAVLASRALEHGFLAGEYRSKSRLMPTVRGSQLASNLTRRGARTLKAIDAVAEDLSIPASAVSVAWLLSQRFVTGAVVNMSEPEQVLHLTRGIGADLSRAHVTELLRASS